MKNAVSILMLLLFLSCNKQEDNLLILPDETTITGKDYPNELIVNSPWSIDIIDDKLLLFIVKGDNIIKAIDANKGTEINTIETFGNLLSG